MPMISFIALPQTVGVNMIVGIDFSVLSSANFTDSPARTSRFSAAVLSSVKLSSANVAYEPMIRLVGKPFVLGVNMHAGRRNNCSVRYLLAATETIGVAGISLVNASSGDGSSYFGLTVMIIRIKFTVLSSANFTNCSGMTVSLSSAMRG